MRETANVYALLIGACGSTRNTTSTSLGPHQPITGQREALDMISEEGLEQVWSASATGSGGLGGLRAWGGAGNIRTNIVIDARATP